MLLIKKICKFFTPPQVPRVLDHITDVGASQFEGTDSTYRIRQQYQNVNVQNPCIIPAGHSPLHVAFAGTTCLAPKAQKNAKWILNEIFNIKQKKRLPIALNSAPRNSDSTFDDGKEDSIFWVKVGGNYADYLVYGLQVVEWVKVFHKVISVQRIISIKEIIEDTSHGSQFRSAEHLPLVHVLAAMGELDEHGIIEDIPLEKLKDRYPHPTDAIVVPFDEFKNGRIVVDRKTADAIMKKGSCKIPELSNETFIACSSMTQIKSGELSVWPCSNYFPNRDLAVLSLGTRWAKGKTFLTYDNALELIDVLKNNIGTTVKVEV